MSDPAANCAAPRIAAGALFVNGDGILLVHKTYGNGWDIPGGYADTAESPAAACRRELEEELGIEREARRLLIVDWAPHVDEGDKILFIFDCGGLGDDEQHIRLASDELDQWAWAPIGAAARIRHLAARPAAGQCPPGPHCRHPPLPGTRPARTSASDALVPT